MTPAQLADELARIDKLDRLAKRAAALAQAPDRPGCPPIPCGGCPQSGPGIPRQRDLRRWWFYKTILMHPLTQGNAPPHRDRP